MHVILIIVYLVLSGVVYFESPYDLMCCEVLTLTEDAVK